MSLLLFSAVTGYACTCVSFPGAKDAMSEASVVFLGTVVESKLLPQHPEMRGRRRYQVEFRVERYWKGNPGPVVALHDLEPGTDCLGGGFEPGGEYLVYAAKDRATDHQLDGLFWFGWTDVLPEGTSILVPVIACMPGGKMSDKTVRKAVRALGKGRDPRKG